MTPDEVTQRIAARRARSRATIEGLREIQEPREIRRQTAEMAIIEAERNYRERYAERAELPQLPRLPRRYELRDYSGRIVGVYLPAGGRRYDKRRKR